ncbi:MAG TPA: type VI secretion system contractile sheath small subunit [Rhodothermales bacterium]|nr:type VI secretion system contractile sheath small subunit [Bacteroidota bacterium]HRK72950.1 type VI secretion system contractile sheath small subunit [Rhodothermales bacterium]HRR07119.1 type VI secretion system contractile sheath small subunit [Rhodothermales bacterium]
MSSFQHEKPPARINLFLDVKKGDAMVREELPFRMLVMGDFGGSKDEDIADRDIINVNKDNFEDILKSREMKLDMVVANHLKDDPEAEMKVQVKVESMKDFTPENVAKQIPELDKMLATRNLLQDLRNRVITLGDFRRQLETIIKDKEALARLADELHKIVPDDGQGA